MHTHEYRQDRIRALLCPCYARPRSFHSSFTNPCKTLPGLFVGDLMNLTSCSLPNSTHKKNKCCRKNWNKDLLAAQVKENRPCPLLGAAPIAAAPPGGSCGTRVLSRGIFPPRGARRWCCCVGAAASPSHVPLPV